MNRDDERERELSAEDARWIRAVDLGLRPEPMSPARRAAFRAAIEERVARTASPWRFVAPACAAAAALVALWLVRPAERDVAPIVVARSDLYGLAELDADSAELSGNAGYLPDDYRAIALLIAPDELEP